LHKTTKYYPKKTNIKKKNKIEESTYVELLREAIVTTIKK